MFLCRLKAILIIFFAVLSCISNGYAEVEWSQRRQFNLYLAPLDIASSLDGLWIYILSPGEVVLYSVLDDKVISRIPVDKSFDRISYSSQSNTLFVSSSAAKTIKLIQLEVLQKFSLDGLAYKGHENAPVTIAVFSDYQ